MPCEGTGECRPPRRSPGSSERPEPSLATLMGPPGSPWSLSAPINHVRSIEQSAAWPKSVVDCEPGGRAGVGGPPFLQVVRTGLALPTSGCRASADEPVRDRQEAALVPARGSNTTPLLGAASTGRVCPVCAPHIILQHRPAHDVRAKSA
jgi:hypothetical protein